MKFRMTPKRGFVTPWQVLRGVYKSLDKRSEKDAREIQRCWTEKETALDKGQQESRHMAEVQSRENSKTG